MTDKTPLFLDHDELVELTGRKLPRLQIAELKRMLIPFRINALGRPVVTRSAVQGSKQAADDGAWRPVAIHG